MWLYHSSSSLEQKSPNYCPWTKCCLLLAPVNKVLLTYGHVHSFTYWLRRLSWRTGSWVGTTKTIWPVKPKIFPTWPFTKRVCCPLNRARVLLGAAHHFKHETFQTTIFTWACALVIIHAQTCTRGNHSPRLPLLNLRPWFLSLMLRSSEPS